MKFEDPRSKNLDHGCKIGFLFRSGESSSPNGKLL